MIFRSFFYAILIISYNFATEKRVIITELFNYIQFRENKNRNDYFICIAFMIMPIMAFYT